MTSPAAIGTAIEWGVSKIAKVFSNATGSDARYFAEKQEIPYDSSGKTTYRSGETTTTNPDEFVEALKEQAGDRWSRGVEVLVDKDEQRITIGYPTRVTYLANPLDFEVTRPESPAPAITSAPTNSM